MLVKVKYRTGRELTVDQTAYLIDKELPDLENDPKEKEVHFEDFLGMFSLSIGDILHVTPL